MEFYKKLNPTTLKELLTIYTRRFIKVLLRGEQYAGEYDRCKRLLQRIQQELLTANKEVDPTNTTGIDVRFQY